MVYYMSQGERETEFFDFCPNSSVDRATAFRLPGGLLRFNSFKGDKQSVAGSNPAWDARVTLT